MAEEYEAEEQAKDSREPEDRLVSIQRWEDQAFTVQAWTDEAFGPYDNRYTYKVTKKGKHFMVSYNSENGGTWHGLMVHQDGYLAFCQAVAAAWREYNGKA